MILFPENPLCKRWCAHGVQVNFAANRCKYPKGDMRKVRFLELSSVAAARKRYPEAESEGWGVPFPITAVEVHSKVGGTTIEFGLRQTKLAGAVMRDCFVARCSAGIVLD